MSERLFLGIPVSQSIQTELSRYQTTVGNLDAHVRWTPPKNYHVTVAFFGEIESEKIQPLSHVIEESLQDIDPFTLKYESVVFAPPKKRPRMIWATFNSHEYTDMVHTVEKRIGEELELPDYRKSHAPIPHITLARFRTASHIPGTKLPDADIDNFEANSCYLFTSTLTPEGPIYTPTREFLLH